MGNAPSSENRADSRSQSPNLYSPDRLSASPPPGQGTHHSLRTRKRSLDLPDINIGVQPVSIPKQPTTARADRPRPRRQNSNEPWSRQQSLLSTQWQASAVHLQAPPPSISTTPSFSHVPEDDITNSPESYQRQIVRSTLPVPLAVSDDVTPDPSNDIIDTPIVWTGGGHTLSVSHIVDDVDIHVPMDRDGERFIVQLPLTRGTHHILFLVDGAVRVAADMPKTVNSQGALTNYVSVGLSSPPLAALEPSTLSTPLPRSHSFWSSSSVGVNTSPGGASANTKEAEWTNVIPAELAEAAAAEEAYLSTFSANAAAARNNRTKVVTGFDPLPQPQLPEAPALPRHLEKQILNSGVTSSSANSKEKRRGRHGHGHHGHNRADAFVPPPEDQAARVLPVTTASGTDLTVFGGLANGAMSPKTPTLGERPTPIMFDDAVVGDDNSVLPVPSHVILNHLSTSSIRNGVLAVADTVRYKNKFVTTIYYKPT